MKAQTKTSVSKLVARFDSQLKTILMNDLSKARNAQAQLLNSVKERIGNRLSAA